MNTPRTKYWFRSKVHNIQNLRPLLLGDDQHVIEEEQVVALVAESPPDAELFGVEGQLAALLQPPR